MDFRIADTFQPLSQLTGEEQKSVKTTAFDRQLDPSNPAMQFHKLSKPKDPNFWSVRVSSDIRLIVHRPASSLMLCYVDHHDAAYAWAERRKIERHPRAARPEILCYSETAEPRGGVGGWERWSTRGIPLFEYRFEGGGFLIALHRSHPPARPRGSADPK